MSQSDFNIFSIFIRLALARALSQCDILGKFHNSVFTFFFFSGFRAFSSPVASLAIRTTPYAVRIFILSVSLFDECLLRNSPKKRNYNDDDDDEYVGEEKRKAREKEKKFL